MRIEGATLATEEYIKSIGEQIAVIEGQTQATIEEKIISIEEKTISIEEQVAMIEGKMVVMLDR